MSVVKYIRPKYNNLQEWMQDENNVYIGRSGIVFINKERYPKLSSKFANPFKIDKNNTREDVLKKYRKYIMKTLESDDLMKLENKKLGCWCKPENCHGDILLELIQYYKNE